ncbi:MAG: hypothetical protein ACKO0Z_12935 [Betaproteobacteria bacterium]
MSGEPTFSERRKALQNRAAERALTRGRKLTPDEKVRNLEQFLGMEPGRLAKMFSNDRDKQ